MKYQHKGTYMFDQLEKLIQPDNESKAKFKEIKTTYYHRKRSFDKKFLTRARIQAIVLAATIVLSMVILLYAYKMKSQSEIKIEKLTTQIELLETKLAACANN